MAAKRSSKSSKAKPKKKIKKSSPARAKGKPKAKPKARRRLAAKPRAKAKRKLASKPRAKAKPKARAKVKTKVKAKSAARPKAKAQAPGKAAQKFKLKAKAGGAFEHGEPQGLLELEEGPPMEFSPDSEIPHIPPAPKKRRAKGHQLSMLDYPGESLTVGMQAPEFSLPSTLGRRVSLSEFRGKQVALYFYPKDDTPGCTMEACGFRDNLPRIEAKDAVVLGISLDDELSHERFAQKYNLPFPLLSDKDAAVSRQYGTYKEKSLYGRSFWGIERTTFVIDRDGKVEHVFRRVKVEGHAEEVMATLAL